MKAVYIASFGGAEKLEIRDVPDPPPPKGTEVLIRVRAAGVNRADLLQRQGLYPPPAGYSPNIPGLEFAGDVIEAGEQAGEWKAGDPVFGITAGEAQAEKLTVDASLVARIPAGLDFEQAAAVPEAFITAHDAVMTQGELKQGEVLMVNAAGSGVGLAAIQLAKAIGAKVIGTSRTAGKLERCREFGLDEEVLTAEPGDLEDHADENAETVDVILDLVGAAFFGANLTLLRPKGRLLLIGLTSGRKAEFDLSVALRKRLKIVGSVLRSRSLEEKGAAVRAFSAEVLPFFEKGILRPNLDRVFDAVDVREAHEFMAANRNFGKLVLRF
ncbi:MAG: NAD(P)H-quinone oxidoreductase [Pyrinomonadaceae bacterium]